MRVVNNEQLKKLKKSRKVNPSRADALLEKSRPVPTPPDPHVVAVHELVLSVADVVRTTSEMNARATNLLDNMFVRVSTVDTPPQIIMPEPARRWKFTVERDDRNLIKTVDAERIE